MAPLLSWMLLVFVSLTAACTKKTDPQIPEIIQTSQLADGWYSHNKQELNTELDEYFALSAKHFTLQQHPNHATALVVPHAGYFYSGLCAASAYQSLMLDGSNLSRTKKNTAIKRVIILSPCHSQFYQGVALPDYTVYKTVFGTIPVDTKAVVTLSKHHLFRKAPEIHLKEHGIEMQLPFLQKTVADFEIVPLIIGQLPNDHALIVADTIASIIDETTLIVVSSDFTHHGKNYDYVPFAESIARNITRLDSLAIQALCVESHAAFNELLAETHATICGQEPLRVLMHLLEGGALGNTSAEVTSYYSSAQIPAARPEDKPINIKKLFVVPTDKEIANIVSYAGIVYRKVNPAQPENNLLLNGFEKESLLNLARSSIQAYLAPEEARIPAELLFPIITPRLDEPCGLFATLKTDDDRLRGCIGTMEASLPMYKTTYDMAISAAFGDVRFLPLAPGEEASTRIELSLLTPITAVNGPQDIILGKHGIILKKHNRDGALIGSALFLPNVARELNLSLDETLAELSVKAGLPSDSWKKNSTFFVFETYEIKEPKQ